MGNEVYREFVCELCGIDEMRNWRDTLRCCHENPEIQDRCLARWRAVPNGVLVVLEDEVLDG